MGAINLFYELQTIDRDLVGIPLNYRFPSSTLAWLVPLILASAVAAAIVPAENAVRMPLAEALEYE
jgi:hypothetical protein